MSLTKSEPTVVHHTSVLERHYAVPPERVFAAFADPARKRRWYGESHTSETVRYELDFRLGGAEVARFRFPQGHQFEGVEVGADTIYVDIVPERRIVAESTMNFGGRRISSSLLTFEFLPAGDGTDLVFTHQDAFFEGADGPDMRDAGWRKIFESLDREIAR